MEFILRGATYLAYCCAFKDLGSLVVYPHTVERGDSFL